MKKIIVILLFFYFYKNNIRRKHFNNLYSSFNLRYRKINKIPKVIHKIIITKDYEKPVFPDCMQKAIDSFSHFNPEYKIKIYSGNDCLKYIKNNYSYSEYFIFENLIPYAYKCDFMKYLILYNEGGIYCDMKSVCLQPFDKIFPPHTEWFSARDVNPFRMSNGFIASISSHLILYNTIEKIKINFFSKNKGIDNLFPTGPTTLAYGFEKYLQNKKYSKKKELIKSINSEKDKIHTIDTDILRIENIDILENKYELFRLIDLRDEYRKKLSSLVVKNENNDDRIYIGSHQKKEGILYFYNHENICFLKTKYTKDNGQEFSAGEWDKFSDIKGNNYNILWNKNKIYKNISFPLYYDNRFRFLIFLYILFVYKTIIESKYSKKKIIKIRYNHNKLLTNYRKISNDFYNIKKKIEKIILIPYY